MAETDKVRPERLMSPTLPPDDGRPGEWPGSNDYETSTIGTGHDLVGVHVGPDEHWGAKPTDKHIVWDGNHTDYGAYGFNCNPGQWNVRNVLDRDQAVPRSKLGKRRMKSLLERDANRGPVP